MRILIYGGSFNPPHAGHVQAARVAAAALEPDKLFFIPTATPPHKDLPAGSPTPEQRLEMTALAAAQVPGGEALDIELCREGKSYTADTLREIQQQYPQGKLVFLVGTDMLLSLDRWHEPEKIFALASVAVLAREKERTGAVEEKARYLRARYGASIHILAGEPVEVSSSQVRALLPDRGGRPLLPEEVYAYIIRHRLYGAKPEFDWLRERAYTYLKPKRVPHVRGVEQEARSLAQCWGVSEDDAAEAAIVHDITKRLELDDQLRLCEKYGIMADAYERASEKLLHAKTGAAFAQELFGFSQEVVEAVRWHTTGRAGMTVLEQIIYLADYIEPNREGFAGLEELRRAAYDDLDAAMELGTRMSLAEISGKGYEPHINTTQCHRWFLDALRRRGLEPIHAPGVPDAVETNEY